MKENEELNRKNVIFYLESFRNISCCISDLLDKSIILSQKSCPELTAARYLNQLIELRFRDFIDLLNRHIEE